MRYSRLNIRSTKLVGMIALMLMSIFIFALPIKAEGDFVVSDIASDGTITTINSFGNFNDAKTTMLTYPNGVITHNASLSPSKIIAMTRGIAVSYTFRYGSLGEIGYSTDQTMTITQYESATENQKQTYIGSHYDMQYIETRSYDPTTGNGRVNIVVSGFNGFVDLQQIDLVPMVYLENNLPITLGGNTFDPVYEAAFVLSEPKQLQFSVVGGELIFERWSFYNGVKRNNVAIGPKADWMQDGAVYYSYDFNNFYTDRQLSNLAGTYYNYYQYLPLRSKTNVTASQLNTYLLTKKTSGLMIDNAQLFVNAQNTYGVNALLLYAIACQESNYGTSDIALRTNNLFGINAIDSDPSQATTFANVEACINDMTGWFLRRYMDINDWRFFGSHLGSKESGFNVKYASDPYWGVQIAAIAYSIDKANTLVDYKYYSYGVINDYNVAIKKLPDPTAANWYTSAYGATYQQDFMVILNHIDTNFYQVPTTNPIENATLTTLETARRTYDFLESVGYIDETKVTLINESRYIATTSNNPVTKVVYPEYISDGNIMTLSSFAFDIDGLDLAGYSFNKGVAVRNLTDVDHALVFKNTTTAEETVIALADGVADPSIDTTYPVRDLSFTAATFTGSNLDLSTLANGEYEVLLRTSYDRYLAPFDTNINLETVPDVSSITQSLVFSETDNKLYLTIDRIVEKEVLIDVDTFTWGVDENENKLFIEGVAALRGVNHNDRTKIKQQLIIYDVTTSVEYPIDLTTYNNNELGTYLFSIGDDTNYYFAWFSNYIDISTLPYGDYRATLHVEITSDDGNTKYVGEKQLMNTLVGNIPTSKVIDGKTIVVNKNGRYMSRYEFSIINGLATEYSSISKPTNRLTNFNIDEIKVVDGKLSGVGFMYMFYTDHNDVQLPSYNLYLVNNGTVAFTAPLTTIAGPYDLTDLVKSGHDYTKAWFSFSDIDISAIANGTYDVYISESCGEYFDIIQAFDDYRLVANESAFNAKNYQISILQNKYNKLTLTISDEITG